MYSSPSLIFTNSSSSMYYLAEIDTVFCPEVGRATTAAKCLKCSQLGVITCTSSWFWPPILNMPIKRTMLKLKRRGVFIQCGNIQKRDNRTRNPLKSVSRILTCDQSLKDQSCAHRSEPIKVWSCPTDPSLPGF